ncbi:MAG TPA: DEAD/DEAH box helicase [Planctomycetota bacterium]|jgi:ATP-dependent RNA helicase RhlE
MSFSSFALRAELLRAVHELGFVSPTAIQKDAIPAGLAGRDVLACSATGSGKTAAFLLPILQRLAESPKGMTRALILTPTRELAAQIGSHLAELGRYTNIRGAAVYGGVAMGPQRQALARGADIIIATPGRLLDHMRQSYARMPGLEILVLDEADRMLDMGFLPDIRRIISQLPKVKQTFMFSATVPSEIVKLTREMLKDPATINIGRESKPAAGITHSVYPVPHLLKSSLLLKLVQDDKIRNALVFARTKRRADRVADYLKRNGIAATRIHGDRTQGQRTQALEGFKSGHYRVLVATDVAARGIDIDALSHVINFDLPGCSEDYIHRVGRTARAQAVGDAFTFVSPDQEGDLKAIERALSSRLPRVVIDDFDYSVKDLPQTEGRPQHNSRKPQGQRGGRGPSRPWERSEWKPKQGKRFFAHAR